MLNLFFLFTDIGKTAQMFSEIFDYIITSDNSEIIGSVTF